MLKTVGDLKKALKNVPDDMPLAGQWLNMSGSVETFKICWAQICGWRDGQCKDYVTDELKRSIERDVAPPYHWKRLKKSIFVIDLGNI